MGKVISSLILCGMMMTGFGCQLAPPVSALRPIEHRDPVDLSGLQPTQILQDLKVSWSVPGKWEALPIKKTLLYTHQQWRSPTLATGVGVAHIQLPLAIPADAVLWFAKNQYLASVADPKDGKLISQWTDSVGRQWFEAQNSKYHVKGYALTRGNEAWIVYSGYRTSREPVPKEIALAERSLHSVVPMH